MALFDDINVRNTSNIRKGLVVAFFVAPFSATPVTALTDATGAITWTDTDYKLIGYNTEDGVTWPRETENSNVTSQGAAEPTRIDVRRSTKTGTINAQETNKTVLEQYLGIDLSAATTATGGETVFQEPELPDYAYVRIMAIAKDVSPTGEYYMGKFMPKARVTATGEQVWSDGDEAFVYPLTYTFFKDDALGFAMQHHLAGPGRSAVAEGFPAPV